MIYKNQFKSENTMFAYLSNVDVQKNDHNNLRNNKQFKRFDTIYDE